MKEEQQSICNMIICMISIRLCIFSVKGAIYPNLFYFCGDVTVINIINISEILWYNNKEVFNISSFPIKIVLLMYVHVWQIIIGDDLCFLYV